MRCLLLHTIVVTVAVHVVHTFKWIKRWEQILFLMITNQLFLSAIWAILLGIHSQSIVNKISIKKEYNFLDVWNFLWMAELSQPNRSMRLNGCLYRTIFFSIHVTYERSIFKFKFSRHFSKTISPNDVCGQFYAAFDVIDLMNIMDSYLHIYRVCVIPYIWYIYDIWPTYNIVY